jgi:hypothetical protein
MRPEEGHGSEHVRLVDAGHHFLAPFFGQAERKLVHALGTFARDDHGVARLAVVFDHALAARGEQAFGRLAHHHQVDVLGARIGER